MKQRVCRREIIAIMVDGLAAEIRAAEPPLIAAQVTSAHEGREQWSLPSGSEMK